ncbi:metallophosphoesterase [Winogradskyella eckloniae]|uniref:metallophosphoesterase n=1 Tax=Winogradskyella eckloniae TaxID=1089306 RepID=UPI0015653426|nr:metallophosphoesterase [Winogradskyella eckloniae]
MSCTTKDTESFSFVQLCDTQLGMGGYKHDIATFKQAVSQINELNTDFVVIYGDLVNDAADSTYIEFKNIMKGLKTTCYVAAGNHDVGNIPNDSTLRFYRNTIGKDYYDFKHKNNAFVVINTQLLKVDVENESKKHYNWFKNTLKTQKEEQHAVFVIGHYPLFTESPNEEEHYFNLPVDKRKEILELFKNNNVSAYLSGHTHKLTINNFEGIQLVSGEATSKNLDDRPLGFRQWEVSKDTITHTFVNLKSTDHLDPLK